MGNGLSLKNSTTRQNMEFVIGTTQDILKSFPECDWDLFRSVMKEYWFAEN